MGKAKKKSFAELVRENKRELLQDPAAMRAIEERIEEKLEKKRLAQAK
ncbi:FbpB family small basic protein [Bacillus xiapuensis]|nr:FbpB family small basic protein [Bacillus xiapuensis]